MLEECGVRVAVVSGRDSPTLRKRMADLGVSFTLFGVKDKAEACRTLMDRAGVTPEQTACIGDDSIDLPAFEVCGVSFAVADAPDYVKRAASFVLSLSSGRGAFREMADRLLEAADKSDIFQTTSGYLLHMNKMAQ